MFSTQHIRDYINKRKETRGHGNTLILYIMWMPLLIGVFGVAVDSAVAVYTQSTLQSGLDTATQSALSRAVNPGTNVNKTLKPNLTLKAARDYTIEFYDANRANGKNPFVKCQNSLTKLQGPGAVYTDYKLVTPASGCAWTEGTFRMKTDGTNVEVTANIVETSQTLFLKLIGIDQFTYNVTSSARVSFEKG